MASILFLLVLFWIFGLYMLFRNNQVYEKRSAILDDMSEAARFDVTQDRDWTWRFNVFQSVSYDEMILKFWKPVDSFYPEGFTDMHMTIEEWIALKTIMLQSK